LLTRFSQLNLL